jgi:tetratricopeptide (TPR) repeat protein
MFLGKIAKFSLTILVLMTILISAILAQKTYSGDPVTKDGLEKALKMKQFKTSDMVAIINEQGCEFKLDKDTQEDLVKAGARPEVIEAVRRNYRGALKIKPANSKTYEGLISQAINIYESESNANEAINFLNQAISLEPNKYRAYQMMGYVLLYGKRKFKDAEDYMKKAIDLGGSAVFRVNHAHDFNFLNSCSGSFYVSRNSVRYEDDKNVHTFQVSNSDIIKIETIGAWGSIRNPKTWGDFTKLKKGLFKVIIQDKANIKDKDNYVFAADTGKGDEAKMVVRLIGKN